MAVSVAVFVFILYITSLVLQTQASDVWKRFAPIPEFDGKTCPVASIAFQIVVASNMFCSILCLGNDLCLGAFYKAESGLCVGCSRYAFENGISLLTNAGTIYISRCLEGVDWTKFKASKYREFVEGKPICAARLSPTRAFQANPMANGAGWMTKHNLPSITGIQGNLTTAGMRSVWLLYNIKSLVGKIFHAGRNIPTSAKKDCNK